ncbi:MAG: helix-turn-helix transcriptional regulator [Bacilli bacterium]|nr:helix-turn-helix transcriptional regulator [Bacilli bacterium]
MELRKNAKYSYQQMANNLGISKTFYWQIENGRRRLSYTMAIKISKIFNMKPDELFYEDLKNYEEKED